MRFVDIPINNLKRRKGRTSLLVLGLMVGIAAVVAVLSVVDSMRADVARRMDELGPNIVVVPETVELPLAYGGVGLPGITSSVAGLEESDVDRIKGIRSKENLNIVAPKLAGIADVGGHRALIVGVLFPEELGLKRWWQVRGENPSGADDALLGSHLAERLNVEPGGRVDVDGTELRVAGILEPIGSGEDSTLFADLHTAQTILKKPNQLSAMEVSAWCIACPIDRIVAEISSALPNARVMAVKQALAAKLDTVESFSRVYLALAAIILLVGSLIVLTTMMASVNERTREIGILTAVGFRRRHIVNLVMIEALIVSAGAGLGGYIAGLLLAALLARPLAGIEAQVSLDPILALAALVMAVGTGTIAAIYPAWKASRLDPASALRSL